MNKLRTNHYTVLEIKPNATEKEIKSAYRKLAVLFHPDKNPDNTQAKEKFLSIKEAYETLIDPEKRKKYDSSYRYSQTYQRKENTGSKGERRKKKNYSFSEREWNDRQSFAKSYHANRSKATTNKTEKPAPYNDFKYIMLAIPLSIAILFLVINVVSRDENHLYKGKLLDSKKNRSDIAHSKKKKLGGLSPAAIDISFQWDSLFGPQEFDTLNKRTVYFENPTQIDAVIYLKNKENGKVIRNNYIFSKNFFYMKNLPEGDFFIYAFYGKEWDKLQPTTKEKKIGSFTYPVCYAKINQLNLHGLSSIKDTQKVVLPEPKKIPPQLLISASDFFSP